MLQNSVSGSLWRVVASAGPDTKLPRVDWMIFLSDWVNNWLKSTVDLVVPSQNENLLIPLSDFVPAKTTSIKS